MPITADVIGGYFPDYDLKPITDVKKQNPVAFEMIKEAGTDSRFIFITAYHPYAGTGGLVCVERYDFNTGITSVIEEKTQVDASIPTKFLNITDIKYINGRLYILDAGAKFIHMYDISAAADRHFADETKNKIVYLKGIGGTGDESEQYAFVYPERITKRNDGIAVYDAMNGAVKLYDFNLLWQNTYRRGRSLLYYRHIIQLPNGDYYTVSYVTFDYAILNPDFTVKETGKLIDCGLSEYLVSIVVSDNIPNLIYIVTNQRIIKKWMSNDNSPVGFINTNTTSYGLNLFGGNANIHSFGVSKGNDVPEDHAAIIAYTTQGIVMVMVKESYNPVSVFNDGFVSIPNEFGIDPSDYHQNIGYTALKNLANVTMLMARNIFYKLKFTTTPSMNVCAGRGVMDASVLDRLNDEINAAAIGMNEHPNPDTINRLLKAIHDMQLLIKDAMSHMQKDIEKSGPTDISSLL